MAAAIIDGNLVSEALRGRIAKEVSALKALGVVPGLAVVLVGANPASVSYVSGKERACAEAGMRSFDHRLPENASQQDILHLIDQLNSTPEVHGILVQLPLPGHLDESVVLDRVHPDKDVDGFHPFNMGRLMLGKETPLPCTPHGIVRLLEHEKVQVAGSHVVVVGRSNIVGKPVALMLAQKGPNANATVTLCHSNTKNLESFTRMADILVVAMGKPGFITADMIKPGAVVIDVGVNRVADATKKKGYRLVGDVDFEAASQVASRITPVPGGVGPMTITMLLCNTLHAAMRSMKHPNKKGNCRDE